MRKTEVVTSSARLEELTELFWESPYLATDTETTGLKRFDEVVGISFSPNADYGIYIPIKIWNGQELVKPWKDEAGCYVFDWITMQLLKSKRLITHNGSFDAKVINTTFGIDVIDKIFCDTQLLHHTLDSDPPHGLKPLAAKFISEDANASQDDLKASVIANGGSWNAENKEFYKGNWKLLGTYGAYDTIWTYALFEKFWAELNLPKNAKQLKLFQEEVMPLQASTYDMETYGIRVDVAKTEVLNAQMAQQIEVLEDEVYATMSDQLRSYELNKIFETTKMTKASALGKALIAANLEPNPEDPRVQDIAYDLAIKRKETKRIFNLDAGDDKAFLIYDLMGIPCTEFTASGKRSTAKSTMDALAEANEDRSPVIKMIRQRSGEIKQKTTYVEAIQSDHIDGRIYSGFRQVGTTSGRYSSGGSSINMQTLPKNDTRIKSLFIPDPGWVFVAADYSSLEPRAFAAASGEPKLKKIFTDGLDFYSSIAIDVLGLKGVSANPEDSDYLGTVDKDKRQWVKAIALSIPYGAEAGRLSQLLKVDYQEAQIVVDKYLKAFPILKQWMDRCALEMKMNGYVDGISGRRKRGDIVKELYDKGVRDFGKKNTEKVFNKIGPREGIKDAIGLYLECRNLLNVSRNHKIQSLAASICNRAMIKFRESIKASDLNATIILQVHDELVATCPKEQAERVAAILKECMEHNAITAILDIPFIAEPIITDKSLAEAK
jgi:DNA polymerase I-like protein with 3'-5' exonuclease and polymerase domains